MKSSRNLPAIQLKVGSMMAVALTITLTALIFPTKGVNPFSSKITLVTHYPAVAGLRASSPVWFSGVEVGSVKSVEFVPGSNPPKLRVVMVVEKRVQGYLRADSQASIQGMGLLGDMYVDLSAGSADQPVVQNGSEIAGVPPKDMKDDMDSMIKSAKGLLDNLEVLSRDIREGKGSLGQLANDPALYEELRDAVGELKQFAAALNNGEGSAQKLLQDPELYNEVLAAVKDMRTIVADLKQTEQKIISQETRETIDKTIKTVSRVVERVGDYQEKIDKIRFDFNFGVSKHSGNVSSGAVNLDIWPNENRYYTAGIQKISELYGQETEKTTFDVQLAWRILQTPLFIRGGVIRDEYFVGGLDARLFDDDFKVMLDAYRVELDPIQMDVRVGVVALDLLEFTAGVEDVMRQPFYKAGLTIHYRDDDLLTLLMKTQF